MLRSRVCLLSVLLVLAALIIGTAPASHAAEGIFTGEDCTVEYNGVDAAYAQALSGLYSAICLGYKDTFSLKLPRDAVIKVEAGADATRLWNDGDRYIFLDLADAGDLDPARGYRHVYGLCHEAGHIVMYSQLDSLAGLPEGVGEGWAHYCGSLVCDYVWDKLGAAAWPVPHDYSGDGRARLGSQCTTREQDPTTLAACTFYTIGEQYGHKRVGWAMRGALAPEPRGSELMGRFAEVLDAQAGAGASDLIPEAVRKSKAQASGEVIVIDPGVSASNSSAATDDEGWLCYDDGVYDGMRSMAGSGHAVRFSAPKGAKLEKVKLMGARYGLQHSSSTFRVTVLNSNFNEIKFFEFPFTKYTQRGEPLYWVEFDMLELEVPEEFYVLFDFDPTATDGVYVGFNAHSTGNSFSALPGGHIKPFREGDWMIRTLLDKAVKQAPRPAPKPRAQKEGWLSFDDDGEDGMRSIAGSGHAVKFSMKRGAKLAKVKLKGARYGYPQSDSMFRLSILDSNFDVIKFYEYPYMKFEQRGEPLYWVEFDLLGLKVPGEFYVLFDFNPAATDGVYVGFDEGSSGHSFTGLSGGSLRQFRDGDWMIRALVE